MLLTFKIIKLLLNFDNNNNDDDFIIIIVIINFHFTYKFVYK